LIQPIMAVPERQLEKARRLRQFCYELDGTEVVLLTISEEQDRKFPLKFPGNVFHSRQAWGLRMAAHYMGGQPFLWIEPDSIPLKPNWVEILNAEYERHVEAKFMLSSDAQQFDEIGGIGVYSGETGWLVPTDFEQSSWDLWLIQCVPHLVHRTPLIQHSFGWYGPDGFVKEWHRFPRDKEILRRDAAIFHADKYQDLIRS
jgi:hypothetical protein